jgi:ankyrin repeat protein
VTFLLEAGANVNHRTKDGFTALGAALLGNHEDVVQILTQKGATM